MIINTTDELWYRAVRDLDEGNFSSLESALGGPEGFDRIIVTWFEDGRFDDQPEMLAEALTCACMLGRTETARFLLDNDVDPVAGMKTGLNGFHYAASGGHLELVNLLIERKVTIETKNMYGGTVLGQALWSAINEHKTDHAEIIALLIDAGAEIEHGTLEWWEGQDVPSAETKRRVAAVLSRRRKDE
ncbi:MAG: ankyrin repeat domain-containing protein [Pyrinomonadaceae bacterium]